MRQIYLVVRREVRERVRSTSFRLFTVGLFVLAAAAIVALDQAPKLFSQDEYKLGVVGDMPAGFESAAHDSARVHDTSIRVQSFESSAAAAKALKDGDIDASLQDGELFYETNDDPILTAIVGQALYVAALPETLDQLGISPDEAQPLIQPEPPQVSLLDDNGATEGDRRLVAFFATLSLYLTLALYGNWILTGVVEEKASRIVEVLLGLLRPTEILTGKTLGITIVAVGQFAAAIAGGAIGVALTGADILPGVAIDVIIASIPLYVAGVVLYSLIYAAIGATVTRQSEAQSATSPIAILLLLPYMLAIIYLPENPDGALATVLSIFPLTSPLVMPTRVATGSPSVVELALCYLLLPPAIALVAWAGGRIYSGAVLAGRRVSLGTVMRSLMPGGSASDTAG